MKVIDTRHKTITNAGNRDLYNIFLADLKKYDVLSSADEVELIKLAKSGNKSARDKICLHNSKFVISVAKQYQYTINGSCLTLEDLINEGTIGLIQAIDKYDETRGFKFISYAVWWISQSILNSIMQNIKHIRIPQNKITLYNKFKEVERQLEQQHNRIIEPTELYDELLKRGIISEKATIEEIFLFKNNDNKTKSLSSPVQEGDSMTLVDVIEDINAERADKNYIDKNLNSIVLYTMAKINMPNFIRDHFNDFFGLEGNKVLTLKEIAKKHDVTSETVRQRIMNWGRKIRKYDREHGNNLKDFLSQM